MNLSKLLSKRIPTILGLLFLGAGLAVGVYVVSTGTGGFFPRATPETTPKNIKITNVSHDSFTVSFLTDTAVPGYLKYGTTAGRLDMQVTDDRDQLSGTVGEFTTHHITIRNLQPDTPYYFGIGTANRYIYTDNGKPYTVTTGPRLGGTPEALTAYGSVMTNASTPARDSIVYVNADGGTALSTLVKSSGSYALSLSLSRTSDLSAFSTLTNDTQVDILVQGKDSSQVARATTTVKNAQPVPTITLGQTHDFTTDTSTTISEGDTSEEATSRFTQEQLGDPTETDLASGSGSITQDSSGAIVFLNPSTDGEVFQTDQPVLSGTADPNTTIEITVESNPVYRDTVTTDASGNWSYTPPEGLAEGSHTITITYTDTNGVQQTETRTFIVQAQGETGDPAFTASPSASPKASPKPSPSPSASPAASGSGRTTQPSTSSAQPVSGSVEQTFGLLFVGILLMLGGFVSWQKNAYRKERA